MPPRSSCSNRYCPSRSPGALLCASEQPVDKHGRSLMILCQGRSAPAEACVGAEQCGVPFVQTKALLPGVLVERRGVSRQPIRQVVEQVEQVQQRAVAHLRRRARGIGRCGGPRLHRQNGYGKRTCPFQPHPAGADGNDHETPWSSAQKFEHGVPRDGNAPNSRGRTVTRVTVLAADLRSANARVCNDITPPGQ
jgi:hypothetical protein